MCDEYENFRSDHQPFHGTIREIVPVNNEFCTQTARKLRKLGYAPKVATLYSRFFFISILSVSGIIIAGMRRRKCAKSIGEEAPGFLSDPLTGLIALLGKNTGAGIIIAKPAVVKIVPASSRLRHN
jgi:hypothetical protein